MKRDEFAEAIAWLTTAIGKSLVDGESDQARAERKVRMNVYYECLGDLPIEAFRVACKRCAIERKYQSFPPIAELRELTVFAMQGAIKPMAWAEAWSIAHRACSRCDVNIPGSVEAAFADVPPLVRHAVKAFGFKALYNLPNNAVETARAQFRGVYEQLQEREQRTYLLPASLKKEIAAAGEAQKLAELPTPMKAVIDRIGKASCRIPPCTTFLSPSPTASTPRRPRPPANPAASSASCCGSPTALIFTTSAPAAAPSVARPSNWR